MAINLNPHSKNYQDMDPTEKEFVRAEAEMEAQKLLRRFQGKPLALHILANILTAEAKKAKIVETQEPTIDVFAGL